MKDYVECMYCEHKSVVRKGEEVCSNCGMEGMLAWISEEIQEVEENIIAIHTITNNLSILIVHIDMFYDEIVQWRYSDEKKIRTSKLQTNKDGSFKFRCGRTWYNLHEFIRV